VVRPIIITDIVNISQMSAWRIVGELGQIDGGNGAEPDFPADDLATVTGWTAKSEGWCRRLECIPASFIGEPAMSTTLTVPAVAGALGTMFAVDAEHRIAVIGSRPDVGSTIAAGVAPEVELLGLDGESHRLFENSPGKTLLVAFSSWCGCRHDLPGWQALRDELAEEPLEVIGIAIDESAADVVPFTEHIDFPVLIDTDRAFADAYGLVNVPTIIWVDEDRKVVRAPSTEFSDDTFVEVHGVESGPHLEAVRHWVRDGTLPDDTDPVAEHLRPFTPEQRQARVEFRLALELDRAGHPEAAAQRVAIADALAPDDFTIWRAGMKLVGDDPFGAEFFERYLDWQQRHGGPLSSTDS